MNLNNFDKMYCLHCIEDKDRYNNCQNEFSKVGILDKIDYYITSKISINVGIQNNNNLGRIGYNQIKNDATYYTTLNHYHIIDIAYKSNYNYIIVFEDDIKLIKKEYFDLFMNNIPNNFDIILFKYYFDDPNLLFSLQQFKENQLYIQTSQNYWSSAFYALSRRGMEYYLEYTQKCKFGNVSDLPFGYRNDKDINFYISSIPLSMDNIYKSTIYNDFDYTYKYIQSGIPLKWYNT